MNKEKLTGYWEKAKETLGKVSKKMWILIGIIAAVILALAIAAIIYFNTRPYATLISEASEDEVTTVTSWLQEQGVTDYKTEGTGTILVPQSQVMSLKTRLLQEQYTNTNSPWQGYFERVSALSTVKDRENAWQITLIEALESTIRGFDNVRDAEVYINFGQDNGYVLDTNNVVKASASVRLTMEQGKLLTDEQANAIRYLIAKGVAGLEVSEVTISDTKGNIYDGITAGGSGDAADSTALALQAEQWWSNQIQSKIEHLLNQAFLEENVSVAVRPTIELGQKTVNDYDVHLPEFAQDGSTDGRGIIGTQFYTWQVRLDDDTVAGGLVGTPSNSDLPMYVENGETVEGLLGRLAAEGNIEYNNPVTQTQMVITAATLKDVTVSVMINTEPESGPIELPDNLINLIASAAGIQAPVELEEDMTVEDYLSRKVTVVGFPFVRPVQPEPEPGFLDTINAMGVPTWAFFAAIGGLLLFVVILVTVILLVRRGRRKKQAAEQKAIEELMSTAMPGQTTVIIGEDGQPVTVTIGEDGQPVPVEVQLDEDGNPVTGADVMDLHTERSMELRQSIRDFVDENMEVAALLIKSWMKEDGENG